MRGRERGRENKIWEEKIYMWYNGNVFLDVTVACCKNLNSDSVSDSDVNVFLQYLVIIVLYVTF